MATRPILSDLKAFDALGEAAAELDEDEHELTDEEAAGAFVTNSAEELDAELAKRAK